MVYDSWPFPLRRIEMYMLGVITHTSVHLDTPCLSKSSDLVRTHPPRLSEPGHVNFVYLDVRLTLDYTIFLIYKGL